MITVNHLKKNFDALEVLKDFSFTLEKGKTVAIIGPSGSGKSTMLRCLIGLEHADGGDVMIEGEYFCKNGVYLSDSHSKKIRSKMGMVFQHFNLFPHLRVKENLLCAPKTLKMDSASVLNQLAEKCLAEVGLSDKINEWPGKLSGGQKQRVAIARALMLKPDILLFDEPTSALDPELTGEVLSVIKKLTSENMTIMVVTHEIGFAKEAAHQVIFMDNGSIVEEGTPAEVIDNPKTERAKMFLQKVY